MFELINDWSLISFFIYIGLLLFVAKIIKEKVPFLNRIIIPSALIAGFIGLILSDGFLNVIDISDEEISYQILEIDASEISNEDLPLYVFFTYDEAINIGLDLDLDNNGEIDEYENTDIIVTEKVTTSPRNSLIFETVYHALAIGFIALTLRRDENPTDKKVWSTGMVIVITYLLQALIGVSVVVLLFKDIFLGAGLLLPLGFGQGPGLATTQGFAYATNGIVSLPHGGALGASIASMGFLVGGIIGVVALNVFARKKGYSVDKFHKEESVIKECFEMETIKEIRVFDSLTMQVVIIFLIYGVVYLVLSLLEHLLMGMNSGLGNTFAGVFHGFNFLFGIVFALIYKGILTRFERKGKNTSFLTNNYVLSNISSLAFNFMIVASVLTITNEAVETYYLLVLSFAVFGSIGTFMFIKWISKKIYEGEFELHYFLGMFGMLTGTASTGLALLKGVDKDFKSPVAEEMVVGSGTAISMALPLFALLMFPTLAVSTGNNIYNVLVFLIPLIYGLVLLGLLLFVNRKK